MAAEGLVGQAAIRDLHDHSIVGWSMGERQAGIRAAAA